MEHRHNKRIDAAISLRVMLFSRGKPVAIGKISNISSGGAFIETSYRLATGRRYIEFAFISDEINETKKNEYRTKALIIHQTENGFGVMTENSDSLSALIHQRLVIREKPTLRRVAR